MSRRAGKTYRPKISAGGLACGSARLSHKHNDNFTADFSAVYTPAFLDMIFIRPSWFDQEVTIQYFTLNIRISYRNQSTLSEVYVGDSLNVCLV